MLKDTEIVRARLSSTIYLTDEKADAIRGEVRRYMRSVKAEHIDPATDELNTTSLAEDAAQKFDLYFGAECQIPDDLFEWAFQLERGAR